MPRITKLIPKPVREGIRAAVECFGADRIYLEAQTVARPFYERQGFRALPGEFEMDGIPHVRMVCDCRECGFL